MWAFNFIIGYMVNKARLYTVYSAHAIKYQVAVADFRGCLFSWTFLSWTDLDLKNLMYWLILSISQPPNVEVYILIKIVHSYMRKYGKLAGGQSC